MPYRLSAFADEISTDIQVQMDHLSLHEVNLAVMRSANARNVLDFEEFQVPLMKSQFTNRKVRFSCIGSPIGKAPITEPFESEMARFRVACQRAQQFETRAIRLFSFRIPRGEDPAKHRDEVLRRMKAFAAYALEQHLNLLLENEKGVYGDTADRCADLLTAVNAPNLMAAFDFANFVQVGEDPLAAWPKLKKWVKDFHVKDATREGVVQPAGQGVGRVREVLTEALRNNWTGLLTLEPHLDKTPGFEKLTGHARFQAAVEALKGILREIG